ncbi:MAG: DUF5335 family protein [Tepidisphaeraceae bacterium]
MQSHEIPDEQWIDFFNRFSRDHAGWPVTIELMSEETGPQHLVQELPLQGISFDPAGSRPCTINVGAGDSPSANISHVVDLPLHIRLADDERGSTGTIQIEPADGPVTLVHYHRPEA